MPDNDLPTDVVSGKVVARLIKTVADGPDLDTEPDEAVIAGTLKFTPLVAVYKNPNPNLATVVPGPVVVDIDSEGYLTSEGERGVRLPIGPYKVNYRLLNARIRPHRIDVLATHTDENPLNLTGSIPPMGPIMTPGEYATLSARIDALHGVTQESIDAQLMGYAPKEDLTEEIATRLADDVTILEQLGNEIALRSQADTDLTVRLELLEAVGAPDLSGFTTDSELAAALADYVTDDQLASALSTSVTDADLVTALAAYVTDAELTSALAGKAATVHTHTSASISDFREAVEDAMAATLVGSGISISHEDGSDTITLTGVAGSDAEAVRDAIGAALIGVGPISIVPNDSGDTIVITVSATVNSTDAALRDRSTHTGSQAISTITGLQAALDAQAAAPPNAHGNSHKKDTGSDPLTPADIGAATAAQGAKADTAVQPATLSAAIAGTATAAQGAKADTAVQPADLSVYATDAEVAAAIAGVSGGGGGGSAFKGAFLSPTLSITDNFTGANSASSLSGRATLTGGKTWTVHSGTWGISSGQAYDSTNNPATEIASIDSGLADVTIRTTLYANGSGASRYFGIAARLNAAGTNGYIVQYHHPAGQLIVNKITGLTPTQLGAAVSYSLVDGDVMDVVVSGSTITVKINGVEKMSRTDTTYLTNTRHGLWTYTDQGRFDDFSVTVPSVTYMTGDFVVYGGEIYRSSTDNNVTIPGADASWVALNVKPVGVSSYLLDYAGSVPAGVPSGTIVFEKAPAPTTWDFTLGSLPSGWASYGGASASFSGSGMNMTFGQGTGYKIDSVTLPREFVLEMWMLSQASYASVMFGPQIMTAIGSGVQGSWYHAPAGFLLEGMSAYTYSSAYAITPGPSAAFPCRMRIRRDGALYYGSVSIDGGVTWSDESTPLTNPNPSPTRLGIGSIMGGSTAVIQRMILTPGAALGNARAKGWWDGTTLQRLA